MKCTAKLLATIVGNHRCLVPAAHQRIVHTISARPNKAEISKLQWSLGELDRVCEQAEKIVENTHTHLNIHSLVGEELAVITQIFEKLTGTSNSLSEVNKLYQSGWSSKHPVRGLVVLLVAKAGHDGAAPSAQVAHKQLMLAKVVEMIHLATMSHKAILDVHPAHQSIQQHLSNKTSILFGDFFWAKAWKDLGDLNSNDVINIMTAVTVNNSQGQYKSEIEHQHTQHKLNLEYWIDKNYLLEASLPALGCKSALHFAQAPEAMQKLAFDFGQNFGFCMKAQQEIAWFEHTRPSSTRLLDLCSLPVVMHYLETRDLPHEILNAQADKPLDYGRLHSIVRAGPGIEKAREVLQTFKHNSLNNLQAFNDGTAKQCLANVIEHIKA